MNAAVATIKTNIENAFPRFKDKIAVWDNTDYNPIGGNYFDGREIFVRFVSLNEDPPQLNIESALYPRGLAGGKDIELNSSTIIPYSSNLFYEPIPYEFLFTNEVVPQVVVTIDDEQAICVSKEGCGYTYI